MVNGWINQAHRTLSMRRIALAWIALAMLLVVGSHQSCAAADKKKKPADEKVRSEPCHWRLVWTADPATQARVGWNTKDKGSKHRLRWRKKGETKFRQLAASTGLFSYGDKAKNKKGVPLSVYYHHADLEALTPATTYEVQCVSGRKTSPVFHFVTAPDNQPEFSLLFGGDSRSDRVTRAKMNRLIAKLFAESEAATDPADRIIGMMHGGDYASDGTVIKPWVNWMADHEKTVTDSGRLLPVIPTRGNHDRGRLFNECFGFDNEDKRTYYAVSFGSTLRVVTLNTETSIAGDQALWLRDELTKSVPTHRWVVPQYHRPGYAAVKIPGGALAHWVPIFEEFNLKLVCEADGHVIKRTLPIRRGKHDETGVVYVGEGGLGVGQREPKVKRWFLQPPGMSAKGHHVMRLKFTADQLYYECIALDDGKIIDSWQCKAAAE